MRNPHCSSWSEWECAHPATTIEEVRNFTSDVVSYLEKDQIRNVLDLWNLKNEHARYRLQVCRVMGEVKAHLGTYDTPEAIHSSLGGEIRAAKLLLDFIPKKTALTTTIELGDLVTGHLKHDAVFPNDIMVVTRGREKLRAPEQAIRLSREDEVQYSHFGSSFNVPTMPIEWIREVLDRDTVFGVYSDHELVSVASLVASLPEVSAILGVETKPKFRNKGFGAMVVSAAVKEGLKRSRACTLFVRQDNIPAQSLYRKIGFTKVGEELWIDMSSGVIP